MNALGSFCMLGLATAFAVSSGCGGSRPSGFTSKTGVDAGSGSAGSGPLLGDAAPSCPAGQLQCSSDLHDVVDCNGAVVKACPADQGCAGATCVPACDSAAANKTNVGCEYYAVVPDTISVAYGSCFAVFVANTWNAPVTLATDLGGKSLDVSTFAYVPAGSGPNLTYRKLKSNQLAAGEVAVLFLDDAWVPTDEYQVDRSCPQGTKAAVIGTDTAVHGTGLGAAFHVTASAPVAAFDMFPFGGGATLLAGATMLLPTAAWGTNYMAVSAYGQSSQWDKWTKINPFISILAQEDATTVSIHPTAAITAATGVAAASKGTTQDYVLSKGQYLQVSQDADLSGSPITADKPIALWGGHTCLTLPLGVGDCNTAHQQIPAISSLGSEYVGVRYRNRYATVDESPPWRVVGMVDGTVLSYEPAPPTGAPTTLSSGEVAEFDTGDPFVVRSQGAAYPFYMSAHMTGAGQVGADPTDGRGDPEFTNVIPSDQFLSSYVFFTDPTYPETSIVVTRRATKGSFKDVVLDCAGALTGWQPIGTSTEYEYTRFDLVTGNFENHGNCDNGGHTMYGDAAFGVTIWGWGSAATEGLYQVGPHAVLSQWVSYAYPAGAGAKPINTVVVPVPH